MFFERKLSIYAKKAHFEKIWRVGQSVIVKIYN